jgi:hypothetical protein
MCGRRARCDYHDPALVVHAVIDAPELRTPSPALEGSLARGEGLNIRTRCSDARRARRARVPARIQGREQGAPDAPISRVEQLLCQEHPVVGACQM